MHKAPIPVPDVTLNNGVTIPQLGFGVFKVGPEETSEITAEALSVGYRHIDTAQMYGNEAGVGQAVRDSGIPRGELFVTSKLNNQFHAHDAALEAFQGSLDALDIGYMDLFLIHWPLPGVGDFVETWQAMEEMLATGHVRAIGVSNFTQEHLARVLAEGSVVPAVNQIEVHPYLTQDPLRQFCVDNGVAVQAWSPLARGRVLDDPVIVAISERIARTPSQVVLRWHVERGDIVFPKTSHRERMIENFEIFDFDLTDEDMAAISGLNRGERTGPDPAEFNWVP
jgi:2,5-diketo-D-gluconate reductase A